MTEQASRSVLHAWLQDQSGAGHQVWAVLDASAALSPPTRRALDRCSPSINLLTHRTRDDDVLAVAPRLIEVNHPQPPAALERLWLDQPADEPAVFFVSTSLEAPALEAALRPCVRAELPDGEVMLFRWWDARIWWALQQLASDQHPEVLRLMRIFASSLALTREGAPLKGSHPPVTCAPDPAITAIKLSQTTCDRLLELGEADAVLGVCRAEYPGALDLVVPEQRHALACSQIDWAISAGFGAPHDHALALRIAAELGADWPRQEEWLDVIASAKSQGRTLLAAIGAM